MTAQALFITGTDTGVGKTLISAAMLNLLAARGLRAVGMKPVASGCSRVGGELRNEDALTLITHSKVEAPYDLVNPYRFEPAIAPHIAAQEAGVQIEIDALYQAYTKLSAHADIVVIEGAGGWLTPLNEKETLADFAKLTGARVLLVVGLRLGCINHALLTARAIADTGLSPVGWIANTLDPRMQYTQENILALKERLRMPLLGVVAHDPGMTPQRCAAALGGNIGLG